MIETGKVLFKAFFNICCLVKGPQDIPESGNLLAICLVVYGCCSATLAYCVAPVEKAILIAVIGVLLSMAFHIDPVTNKQEDITLATNRYCIIRYRDNH